MSEEVDVNALIPYVDALARRLWMGQTTHALSTREDLVAAGVCGLMEARDRYDGSVPFKAYARMRIEGAMQDELRALDARGRTYRVLAARTSRTQAHLRQEKGREVTASEVAIELSIEDDEAVFGLGLNAPVQSLSEVVLDLLEGGQSVEAEVLHRQLWEAVARLGKTHQTVLSLVYVEELSYKEAAVVLKLSPVRVAALHARALTHLRNAIAPRGDLKSSAELALRSSARVAA